MSLLSLIKDVCAELSLTIPNSVINSNTKQIAQLLVFANKTGRDLVKFKSKGVGWSFLQKEFRFKAGYFTRDGVLSSGNNTINIATYGIDDSYRISGEGLNGYSTITSITPTSLTLLPTELATLSGTKTLQFFKTKYALPQDYDSLVSDTYYPYLNVGSVWRTFKLDGRSSQYFNASNNAHATYYNKFMIKGKYIYIEPNTSSEQIYTLVYISKNWVVGANGEGSDRFVNDEDDILFDYDLLSLGIVWRFKAAQGLPYEEDYQLYTRKLDELSADDGGSESAISLDGGDDFYPYLSWRNFPEGNYGID